MIVVVSDTSPIRALAFLGQLSLLETLFGTVVVPPAVAEELRKPARRGPGELPLDLSMHRFIEVRAPADRARVAQLENELDRGESEALVLAEEIGAQAVLMDESAGRMVAERMGLVPLGTVGILLVITIMVVGAYHGLSASTPNIPDRATPLTSHGEKTMLSRNVSLAGPVRRARDQS